MKWSLIIKVLFFNKVCVNFPISLSLSPFLSCNNRNNWKLTTLSQASYLASFEENIFGFVYFYLFLVCISVHVCLYLHVIPYMWLINGAPRTICSNLSPHPPHSFWSLHSGFRTWGQTIYLYLASHYFTYYDFIFLSTKLKLDSKLQLKHTFQHLEEM